MSEQTKQLGGIVLCGGRSERMGLSKAELPFGPERMLQRVVRLLGTVAGPLVVVAAADQELPELPDNVKIARDRRAERGPLEGIGAGLRQLQGSAEVCYVTGCDVPLIVPDFVRFLHRRLAGNDVVVPVEDRFFHPLAAIYRVSVVDAIEELLAADKLRPVFLFDRVSTCRVPVDELQVVDPQLDTLMNLNRPEDYFAAVERAGYRVPADIRMRLTP